MFTKNHRRIRNRQRRRQPINWSHVAAYTVIGLFAASVALCGLGAIYYGG